MSGRDRIFAIREEDIMSQKTDISEKFAITLWRTRWSKISMRANWTGRINGVNTECIDSENHNSTSSFIKNLQKTSGLLNWEKNKYNITYRFIIRIGNE